MRGQYKTDRRFGARAVFCVALIYFLAFHAFFFGFVSARMTSAEASGLPMSVICHAGQVSQSPQHTPGDENPGLPDCCKYHHCVLCAGSLLSAPQHVESSLVINQSRALCRRARVSWPATDPPLREVGRSENRSPRAPPLSA
ncbi:MAG: DUF2946 family protein [Pseudomonadota bacterium]